MNQDLEHEIYKKFLEQMHDAVFILDSNFNIIDCNKLVTKWYGYSKEEALHLNLHDIRAASERSKIKQQMDDAAYSQGGIWETVHMRKDGTTFPAQVSSTPIFIDGKQCFYHVVRDISAKLKTEKELHVSEERYTQIIDSSPNAIFMHRNEKIIYMNPAGLQMFGATSPEQLVGQSLWILYPTDRHGIVRARNQVMERTGGTVPLIEHTLNCLDGRTVEVEASARLIQYQDKPTFYVVLRDITNTKKIKRFLELQYAVAKCLIESASLIDATTNVLRTICTSLRLEDGKLWTLDKKEQVLRCIAYWRVNKQEDKLTQKMLRQTTVKVGEGLPGEAVASGQPVWFENLSEMPVSGLKHESGFKLGFALPIINGKEVIGCLTFLDDESKARDEQLLDALSSIANQVGLFLKRKNFEKDLLFISKHDPITGLCNRFLFEETLSYALMVARNKDKRLAVLFIDINNFSAINEALGHTVGDEVLKAISNRLIDIGCDQDNLARFGSDQFALFINNIELVEEVTEFVQKINAIFNQAFEIDGQHMHLGVCIGISFYPEDGEDVQTLMRNANIALNHAKQSGASAFEFCTVDMTAKAKKRINIENDLRDAIKNKEFLLYYQPIVDSRSMIVKGFESLLRWRHHGVLISPSDFVPVAEQTQLIVPIGEWIITTACNQVKIWNNANDSNEPVFVSVNISQIQFNYGNVLPFLINILQETKINPSCLKVELTESAIMGDVQKSIKLLEKIKELGVKISIDDFGTGYSSLNYLRNLPIDYLKIDQSFVRTMLVNSNDAAIVKTIINLAHNLSYTVIAEGVETHDQLKYLASMGCYLIQGYYFSRPLISEEATEFLQQGKLS